MNQKINQSIYRPIDESVIIKFNNQSILMTETADLDREIVRIKRGKRPV